MSEWSKEEKEEMNRRYHAACHAMQTGVAFELHHDPARAAATPKHLRVGVNSALVNSSALGELLIKKGIITEQEYMTAMAEGMEAEALRYTEICRTLSGNPDLTLG